MLEKSGGTRTFSINPFFSDESKPGKAVKITRSIEEFRRLAKILFSANLATRKPVPVEGSPAFRKELECIDFDGVASIVSAGEQIILRLARNPEKLGKAISEIRNLGTALEEHGLPSKLVYEITTRLTIAVARRPDDLSDQFNQVRDLLTERHRTAARLGVLVNSPATRSTLEELNCSGLMEKVGDFCDAFEQSENSQEREHLIENLIRSFDTVGWHPNHFRSLTEGMLEDLKKMLLEDSRHGKSSRSTGKRELRSINLALARLVSFATQAVEQARACRDDMTARFLASIDFTRAQGLLDSFKHLISHANTEPEVRLCMHKLSAQLEECRLIPTPSQERNIADAEEQIYNYDNEFGDDGLKVAATSVVDAWRNQLLEYVTRAQTAAVFSAPVDGVPPFIQKMNFGRLRNAAQEFVATLQKPLLRPLDMQLAIVRLESRMERSGWFSGQDRTRMLDHLSAIANALRVGDVDSTEAMNAATLSLLNEIDDMASLVQHKE